MDTKHEETPYFADIEFFTEHVKKMTSLLDDSIKCPRKHFQKDRNPEECLRNILKAEDIILTARPVFNAKPGIMAQYRHYQEAWMENFLKHVNDSRHTYFDLIYQAQEDKCRVVCPRTCIDNLFEDVQNYMVEQAELQHNIDTKDLSPFAYAQSIFYIGLLIDLILKHEKLINKIKELYHIE